MLSPAAACGPTQEGHGPPGPPVVALVWLVSVQLTRRAWPVLGYVLVYFTRPLFGRLSIPCTVVHWYMSRTSPVPLSLPLSVSLTRAGRGGGNHPLELSTNTYWSTQVLDTSARTPLLYRTRSIWYSRSCLSVCTFYSLLALAAKRPSPPGHATHRLRPRARSVVSPLPSRCRCRCRPP